jgi:hypothetical protein
LSIFNVQFISIRGWSMGLTCANLHVFTGGSATPSQEADVDRFLDEAQRPLGFERAERESDADLSLAIIAAPSWLTLLDPANPGVISEEMVKLAQQLSAASRCPVLIASVYDSDDFAFLLFDKGKQVDGFASNEELVPIKFKKWAAKKRSQEWSRLFGKALSPDDMRDFTKASGPFADAMLHRLCGLVGLSTQHASMTWSDLAGSPGQALRRLHFRRSASAAKAAAPEVKHFSLLLGETHPILLGFSARVADLSDPVLLFSGSAIEQQLVEPVGVEGGWLCDGSVEELLAQDNLPRIKAQLSSARFDGRAVIRARLGLTPAILQLAKKPQITFSLGLGLRPLDVGDGEVCVAFLPRSDGTEQPLMRRQFHVTKADWVPLGAKIDSSVRLLNIPRLLSAVAILEDAGDETLARVRPFMEKWLTAQAGMSAGHVEVNYLGQYGPGLKRPKRKIKLALAEISSGKKWPKLFTNADPLLRLVFELVDDAMGKAWAGGAVHRTSVVRETVHLSFWCDRPLSAAPAEMLTKLLDALFAEPGGMQGWLAEWDWKPAFTADTLEQTPYERSRGITAAVDSNCRGGLMRREWCSRYLRGLSGRLWLGRSLLGHVAPEQLGKVARSTEIGPAVVRVDLLPGLGLNRLEEPLGPILPTPSHAIPMAEPSGKPASWMDRLGLSADQRKNMEAIQKVYEDKQAQDYSEFTKSIQEKGKDEIALIATARAENNRKQREAYFDKIEALLDDKQKKIFAQVFRARFSTSQKSRR